VSLAMRQARFAVGDPGLFGFLGSVGKGLVGAAKGFVTGGPAGAVVGAATSLLPKPVSVAKMGATHALIQSRSQTPGMFPPLQGTPGFSGVSVGGPGGLRIGTSTPGTGTAMVPAGTAAAQAAAACRTGFHYNKSDYATKGPVGTFNLQWHEPRTVCVKNRRRNPLNPRALSRAMSRVKSAQRAVRCLQLFAGPAARASSKARPFGGKRKSCKSCR
jgi:hypothetical protein